jgi:hypothetical protein
MTITDDFGLGGWIARAFEVADKSREGGPRCETTKRQLVTGHWSLVISHWRPMLNDK